jgi:plasmid rolling circle replication initiator protein Rep
MRQPLKNPDAPASNNQGSVSKVYDQLQAAVDAHTTRKKTTNQVCNSLEPLPMSGRIPFHRIRQCNNFLKIRNYYQSNTLKLASANFCKVHQICTQCAQRRAIKYAKAVKDTVQIIRGNRPESVFLFLTFTVRNSDDLAEAVNRLNKYTKILMNRFMRGNCKESIMNKINGGFYSVEITNNGSTWHPHIHMLVEATEVIYTHEVRKEWETISNGDSFMCDARPIEFADDESLFNACLEVSKYTLKNTQLTPENLLHAYHTLYGRNLVNRFGSFRGKKVTLNPELEDYADQPFYEYCFNWFDTKYRFNHDAFGHYDNQAQYEEIHHAKSADNNPVSS